MHLLLLTVIAYYLKCLRHPRKCITCYFMWCDRTITMLLYKMYKIKKAYDTSFFIVESKKCVITIKVPVNLRKVNSCLSKGNHYQFKEKNTAILQSNICYIHHLLWLGSLFPTSPFPSCYVLFFVLWLFFCFYFFFLVVRSCWEIHVLCVANSFEITLLDASFLLG